MKCGVWARRTLALASVCALLGGWMAPVGAQSTGIAGSWRTYSSRITYDAGGGGAFGGLTSRLLMLATDGAWSYGSSTGRYVVAPIVPNDWSRWKVKPYGPTRKVTWSNWAAKSADGPIEESGGTVNFIWVVYHEGPPTIQAPGTIWLKFGRPRP